MLHLYLDESGDHSLRRIQASYPLFVLGGVILADDAAVAAAGTAMADFKRRWFGAGSVVLHTADLVRNRGAFMGLKDVALRGRFFDDLNELLRRLEFSVVACAVRKDAHLERCGDEAIDSYLLVLTVLVGIDRLVPDIVEVGVLAHGARDHAELQAPQQLVEVVEEAPSQGHVFEVHELAAIAHQVGGVQHHASPTRHLESPPSQSLLLPRRRHRPR